ILGQAILFGDWRLMIYGGLILLALPPLFLADEEPGLAQTFWGPDEEIPAHVPRRIPPRSPWRPPLGRHPQCGGRGRGARRQAGEHQGRVGAPAATDIP